MAQLMPLPLTVSCFSKIQISFTFLVPADLGSPGQRAVKRVYVCASDDVLRSPIRARAAPQRGRKRQLSDVTNVPGSRELSSLLPPVAVPPPRPRFQPRDLKSEIMTLLEFILGGVDTEDIMFLRRRYEQLLQFDSSSTDWLNDTHWVDHPATFFAEPLLQPPPRKRRKREILEDLSAQHVTGRLVPPSNIHVERSDRLSGNGGSGEGPERKDRR